MVAAAERCYRVKHTASHGLASLVVPRLGEAWLGLARKRGRTRRLPPRPAPSRLNVPEVSRGIDDGRPVGIAAPPRSAPPSQGATQRPACMIAGLARAKVDGLTGPSPHCCPTGRRSGSSPRTLSLAASSESLTMALTPVRSARLKSSRVRWHRQPGRILNEGVAIPRKPPAVREKHCARISLVAH